MGREPLVIGREHARGEFLADSQPDQGGGREGN